MPVVPKLWVKCALLVMAVQPEAVLESVVALMLLGHNIFFLRPSVIVTSPHFLSGQATRQTVCASGLQMSVGIQMVDICLRPVFALFTLLLYRIRIQSSLKD